MNRYEKEARLYPAITGMIIPIIITSAIICFYLPEILTSWMKMASVIGVFLSVSVLYAALGYFFRSIFVETSKLIFQNHLFKEDETKMPTTELLSWKSPRRKSKEDIYAIANKIKADFNIDLYTQAAEEENPTEARKVIVDAVGKMREVTRENENLQQYNRRYGFFRNYLGASVYAIVLILISLVLNCSLEMNFGLWLCVAFIIQMMLDVLSYYTLKSLGYNYARALFNAYMTK